jgi:hypothetical protein
MRIIFGLLRFLLPFVGLAALINYLLGLLGRPIDWVPPPPKDKDNGVIAPWFRCGRGSGDSCTKTIGFAGGTLEVNGHVLEIPEGAVGQDEQVQFTLREAARPEVMVVVTPSRKFQKNLRLRISWARCAPDVNPVKPRIYRREDLEPLDGDVEGRSIVTDRVRHSSGFMVAQG